MIDAHIHYGDDDPTLLALLAAFDLKLLNICVAEDAHGAWRAQAERYQTLTARYPDRFAWCTSVDLPRFDDAHYHEAVIAGLDIDFAAGAVACKIWKNIGMAVRKPDGTFLMPDDAYLDPIYEYLAAGNYPLLTHIAEPLACWLPLQAGTPHYGYYSRNPEWHMYDRPEFPSHTALMAARDAVLAKHPTLRMIGAHLASLEYDVDLLAERLDRYPNLAVDISARLSDLAIQDSAKVRAFFLKYQDRILFGTDVVMRQAPSTLPEAAKQEAIAALRQTYEMHFAYLAGAGPVTVRSYATSGLQLPTPVLEKLYAENAQRWYPLL
ncbi:MAG: amidohydrolase family protein [Caldilineaceae bacterium]|nr:amidohydrolase family protein [Caldilineaceae bacterium]